MNTYTEKPEKAAAKQPIRKIFCDRCDAEMTQTFQHTEMFCTLQKDDFEVVYVRCPKCGKKYQIITTDTEMRALIKKRNSLEKLIKDAFDRRLKQSTIKNYIGQRDRIMKIQRRLNEYLFPIGQQILKEGEKEHDQQC